MKNVSSRQHGNHVADIVIEANTAFRSNGGEVVRNLGENRPTEITRNMLLNTTPLSAPNTDDQHIHNRHQGGRGPSSIIDHYFWKCRQ